VITYKRRAPGRHRAIGEAIGAVLVLVLLIVAAAALTFSIVYMYGALGATHGAQVTAGQPTKENLSMVYVAHIPPNGAPGVVVTNYGIPTTIVEVLQVVGGQVAVQSMNVSLATGSSATIPLQSGAFALVTSSGAVFSYNMGNESYLSLTAFGVSTDPPPGLYYVSGKVKLRSLSGSAEWVVNGSTVDEGRQVVIYVDGPTAVAVLVWVPTQPVTFEAQGLGSDVYGAALIVTVNGQSTTYTVNQLPVTLYLPPGTQVSYSWVSPISGSAGVQYVWESTSGLATAQSGTFDVPSQGGSLIATYGTQYYLTMQANPAAGGSVSPASGWYNAGTRVQISASANSGYQFYQWSGSGSGSYSGQNNPATVTMNGPITETAYFGVQVTLAAQAGGSASASWPGGSASVNGPGSTTFYVPPGTTVQFTASPNRWSWFIRWVGSGSGSYSGRNNPVSVTVNNPISELAKFLVRYL